MTAGDSSLLRPQVAPWARVALLAVLLVAIAAPPARGAGPTPDPSPPSGSVAPDAYPAVKTRPTAVRPVAQTVPTRTPAAPAHVAQPVQTKKVRPKKPTRMAPVVPFRAPDHPAPRLALLARAAVDPASGISARLALTLGLLILLSASLVAGAARELAR